MTHTPFDEAVIRPLKSYSPSQKRRSQTMNRLILPAMTFSEQIGKNIHAIRKARGFTLDVLVTKTGMSKGDLSQIEHGKRNLTVGTLLRIARALDATLTVILSLQ